MNNARKTLVPISHNSLFLPPLFISKRNALVSHPGQHALFQV